MVVLPTLLAVLFGAVGAWFLRDAVLQIILRIAVGKIGLLEPTFTVKSSLHWGYVRVTLLGGTLQAWFAEILNISGIFIPSKCTSNTFDRLDVEIHWLEGPCVRARIHSSVLVLENAPKRDWGEGKRALEEWVWGYADWTMDWLTRHLDVGLGIPGARLLWHEDLSNGMRKGLVSLLSTLDARIDVLTVWVEEPHFGWGAGRAAFCRAYDVHATSTGSSGLRAINAWTPAKITGSIARLETMTPPPAAAGEDPAPLMALDGVTVDLELTGRMKLVIAPAEARFCVCRRRLRAVAGLAALFNEYNDWCDKLFKADGDKRRERDEDEALVQAAVQRHGALCAEAREAPEGSVAHSRAAAAADLIAHSFSLHTGLRLRNASGTTWRSGGDAGGWLRWRARESRWAALLNGLGNARAATRTRHLVAHVWPSVEEVEAAAAALPPGAKDRELLATADAMWTCRRPIKTLSLEVTFARVATWLHDSLGTRTEAEAFASARPPLGSGYVLPSAGSTFADAGPFARAEGIAIRLGLSKSESLPAPCFPAAEELLGLAGAAAARGEGVLDTKRRVSVALSIRRGVIADTREAERLASPHREVVGPLSSLGEEAHMLALAMSVHRDGGVGLGFRLVHCCAVVRPDVVACVVRVLPPAGVGAMISAQTTATNVGGVDNASTTLGDSADEVIRDGSSGEQSEDVSGLALASTALSARDCSERVQPEAIPAAAAEAAAAAAATDVVKRHLFLGGMPLSARIDLQSAYVCLAHGEVHRAQGSGVLSAAGAVDAVRPAFGCRTSAIISIASSSVAEAVAARITTALMLVGLDTDSSDGVLDIGAATSHFVLDPTDVNLSYTATGSRDGGAGASSETAGVRANLGQPPPPRLPSTVALLQTCRRRPPPSSKAPQRTAVRDMASRCARWPWPW